MIRGIGITTDPAKLELTVVASHVIASIIFLNVSFA
jgi:hypothetical protein